MDRSRGINNPNLYDAMYMIEMLTGALLRNTKNLKITVLSYADTINQRSKLKRLSVNPTSGTSITEQICIDKLKEYEVELIKTLRNKPNDTVAGRTMELLESDIEKGVMNTVITFAGTVSNYKLPTNNPVTRIGKAIKSIKVKVGEKNVRFISAGFFAENGKDGNEIQYKKEVKALADNKDYQTNINKSPVTLMTELTNSLYDNGVLCKEQSKLVTNI